MIDFLKLKSLKEIFNLGLESDEFIKTFELNFKRIYGWLYPSICERILSHAESNLNYVLIGRKGGSLGHNAENISVVASSVGSEITSDFVVEIPENSIMQDAYMGVNMLDTSTLAKR